MLLDLKENYRQRGQGQIERIGPILMRHRRPFHTSRVALAASSIVLCITVEKLPPEPSARDAHSIMVAQNRREVADDEHHLAGRLRPTNEAESARRGVAAIDPFEAAR